MEIIIGTHSILEAINNPRRKCYELYGSSESLKDLRNKVEKNRWDQVTVVSGNVADFVKKTQKLYQDLGLTYQRIPSNLCLVAESTLQYDFSYCLDYLKQNQTLVKWIALDQVTDVHNAGAIIRTAAFFGVDAILISQKGTFRVLPSLIRQSSGGLEHVKIVKCASLSKAIRKLDSLGVTCIGLSEHATPENEAKQEKAQKGTCLVLGAEDVGLSHAVSRVFSRLVSLENKGAVSSLNVSVAAGIAMDRFF